MIVAFRYITTEGKGSGFNKRGTIARKSGHQTHQTHWTHWTIFLSPLLSHYHVESLVWPDITSCSRTEKPWLTKKELAHYQCKLRQVIAIWPTPPTPWPHMASLKMLGERLRAHIVMPFALLLLHCHICLASHCTILRTLSLPLPFPLECLHQQHLTSLRTSFLQILAASGPTNPSLFLPLCMDVWQIEFSPPPFIPVDIHVIVTSSS